jgi:hypothetical protein
MQVGLMVILIHFLDLCHIGSTTILIEKPISLVDIKLFKKILALKVSVIYLPVTLIRLIKSLNKNFKINKKYIKTWIYG